MADLTDSFFGEIIAAQVVPQFIFWDAQTGTQTKKPDKLILVFNDSSLFANLQRPS